MAVWSDLCLEGATLQHVDLVLHHELPEDLQAHVQRVGQCLWCKTDHQRCLP